MLPDRAGADWQFNAYGGAVHSFTNPEANSKGARYSQIAAARSWRDMLGFLDEMLKTQE